MIIDWRKGKDKLEAKEGRKITDREFANKVEISTMTLYNWENEIPTQVKSLKKLAEISECKIDDLIVKSK